MLYEDPDCGDIERISESILCTWVMTVAFFDTSGDVRTICSITTGDMQVMLNYDWLQILRSRDHV